MPAGARVGRWRGCCSGLTQAGRASHNPGHMERMPFFLDFDGTLHPTWTFEKKGKKVVASPYEGRWCVKAAMQLTGYVLEHADDPLPRHNRCAST